MFVNKDSCEAWQKLVVEGYRQLVNKTNNRDHGNS
jgi:hypothetical protein